MPADVRAFCFWRTGTFWPIRPLTHSRLSQKTRWSASHLRTFARRARYQRTAVCFFTIFQTFLSGPGDTPYFGDYPTDFFDFIIVDECHRGGANDESTWRGILEYFSPLPCNWG